jgi:UDP-glucuronate decarboxylase
MIRPFALTSLVTGGAGFLGSHVCERLVAEGRHVICLDNFLTGHARNVEALAREPGFELREHDVVRPLPEVRVDEVWNLACPASPPRYQLDPVHTLMTNVLGTHHGLELARRYGARLLQASTSEVYGDPEVTPQRENYRGSVNTTGPRACYDEGKRAAETLCFDYHRRFGVAVKVARIFNTYGPRMAADDGRVVSNFVVSALRGEPLALYGEGAQTRSFCYVDDLVEGLFRLMRSGPDVTGPVNLGNPHEFTVRELAQQVLELTGSHAALVHAPLPADDPRQRCPDISLARELLDWQPLVPLHAGLGRTIEYFRAEPAVVGQSRRRQAAPAPPQRFSSATSM